MLEAKRRELLSSHRDTEGIAVERVPDSMDEFSLEVQRNMAVDALNRKAALLRQVNEALERIARGKYGACLACNEAISPKRLAALPCALLCLECQQATEKRLGTDARECAGLRPGYGVGNSGEQLSNSSSGRDHRLRRSVVPSAPANREASKSEAREARL